ncbi:ABC transporter permease [Staphylococcus edaphicus]|uniref:ABC transporter permease n=1 Tax=Staphylococcus edaphicus TaxID=1955013 RepID=A0A2C6WMS1_9STAP|nr:ABC transporter permease [Staphylococcus edaphicus]PHK49385.1 ABC transporter permease [Staphylococcus edaphicus]UQW80453.1 ABC transporter permease [Staphylococcus edaphicus]
MLLTFLKYENLKFIKSFQFVAPVFLYLMWVIGIYIYTDIPILSSYGSTSVGLYLISTWITIVIFKDDSINERHIFYIQLSSKIKYLLLKMIYIHFISLILLTIALLYPILIGSFDKPMTINLFLIGFTTHFLMGNFGILLGSYVANTGLFYKSYWWLITILFLIVSMIKSQLVEVSPFLKWILWILPPINNLLSSLTEDSLVINNTNFLTIVLLSFTYISIAYYFLTILYKK